MYGSEYKISHGGVLQARVAQLEAALAAAKAAAAGADAAKAQAPADPGAAFPQNPYRPQGRTAKTKKDFTEEIVQGIFAKIGHSSQIYIILSILTSPLSDISIPPKSSLAGLPEMRRAGHAGCGRA